MILILFLIIATLSLPSTFAICSTTKLANTISGTCTTSTLCASAKPSLFSTITAETVNATFKGGSFLVTRGATPAPPPSPPPIAGPPPPPSVGQPPAPPAPAPTSLPAPIFTVNSFYDSVSGPLNCAACFCADNATTACTATAVSGSCVNGYRIAVLGGGFRCVRFAPNGGSGQRLAVGVNAVLPLQLLQVSVSGASTGEQVTRFSDGFYTLNSAGHLLALSAKSTVAALLFFGCGPFVSQQSTLELVTSSGVGVFVPYSVSIANASVVEGNAGSPAVLAFTVTLSAPHPHVVTVNYTTVAVTKGTSTVGMATSGADFVEQSGLVQFAVGETSKVISVLVNGDTLYELDELFTVVLSNVVGSLIADGKGTGFGTIVNDEATVPALSIADVSILEGDSGTKIFSFVVTQSISSGVATTVNFATAAGTASAGEDFVAQSGTLTFNAHLIGDTEQQSKTISIVVNGDTTVENDETFTVSLSGPYGATLAKAQAAGTILDDDYPRLSISPTAVVNEGKNGESPTVAFVVGLNMSPRSAVTVNYATSDGTATVGDGDYVATSGTLTFAAGTTALTQQVSVSVTGDLRFERSETFSITLSAPTESLIIVGKDVGTATINNDDRLPALSISDVTQVEGNSGTSPFTFSVSMPASGVAASVRFAAVAVGSANAGSDFTSTSGTLTFAPNEISKTIDVLVNGDTFAELNENFVVVLSNAADATVAKAVGVGLITNDDKACTTC